MGSGERRVPRTVFMTGRSPAWILVRTPIAHTARARASPDGTSHQEDGCETARQRHCL
jgi:hypothetical protein